LFARHNGIIKHVENHFDLFDYEAGKLIKNAMHSLIEKKTYGSILPESIFSQSNKEP
jgi:hypothetical protein